MSVAPPSFGHPSQVAFQPETDQDVARFTSLESTHPPPPLSSMLLPFFFWGGGGGGGGGNAREAGLGRMPQKILPDSLTP